MPAQPRAAISAQSDRSKPSACESRTARMCAGGAFSWMKLRTASRSNASSSECTDIEMLLTRLFGAEHVMKDAGIIGERPFAVAAPGCAMHGGERGGLVSSEPREHGLRVRRVRQVVGEG